MRVVHRNILSAFQERHAEARDQAAACLDYVEKAQWNLPQDVQQAYGDDAVLPKGRAVFNIKGNKFRIVVAINYQMKIVDIRFADTHKKYDAINALTI